MYKKYYYLLMCLSAGFIAPLAGNKPLAKAINVAEAYKAAPAAAVQDPSKIRSETTAVKISQDYQEKPQQPVQRLAAVQPQNARPLNNHPADQPQRHARNIVETANTAPSAAAKPSATVTVQPQPAQRPVQRPAQTIVETANTTIPATARPSSTVTAPPRPALRPAVVNNRPTATLQPTVSVPTRTVVAAPRRPQAPSRVILETPRPLQAVPLPAAVRLDQRCAPYEFVMLRPYSITPRGNIVELLDGSVWHVSKKRDRRKVRNWSLYDNIIIESSSFFGWTTYSLVNYTRGEAVDATLTQGPVYEGHASHWVAQYDPARRFISLEDGSRWSFVDTSFGDWRENDAVVLGLSKDSTGQYVYMLINTRTMKSSLAINLR